MNVVQQHNFIINLGNIPIWLTFSGNLRTYVNIYSTHNACNAVWQNGEFIIIYCFAKCVIEPQASASRTKVFSTLIHRIIFNNDVNIKERSDCTLKTRC